MFLTKTQAARGGYHHPDIMSSVVTRFTGDRRRPRSPRTAQGLLPAGSHGPGRRTVTAAAAAARPAPPIHVGPDHTAVTHLNSEECQTDSGRCDSYY